MQILPHFLELFDLLFMFGEFPLIPVELLLRQLRLFQLEVHGVDLLPGHSEHVLSGPVLPLDPVAAEVAFKALVTEDLQEDLPLSAFEGLLLDDVQASLGQPVALRIQVWLTDAFVGTCVLLTGCGVFVQAAVFLVIWDLILWRTVTFFCVRTFRRAHQ